MTTAEPGAQLQDLVKASGKSQRKIAGELGISAQAITNWISGRSRPSYDHLVDLEDLLDVDPRGQLLRAFGYVTPENGSQPISIRGAIRCHPDLTAEDKRALLTVLKRFLPDES